MARASRRDDWRDERVAGEYEARRFVTPLQRLKHGRDERLLLALLGGEPRSVLDLACGTGRFQPRLAVPGRRVVGADVSLEMLRAGRRARPGAAALVQAEAEHLPFRSAAFDAVVCMRFLFHLQDGERRRALTEMGRVARSGRVVAQVRYRWTLKHLGRWLRSRVGLARRYRPAQGRAELARELGEAGLELVALRPISRLFSDKALLLAFPARIPGRIPGRIPETGG